MTRVLRTAFLPALLMMLFLGTAQAQVLMPGPSGTLLNAVAATTTSATFPVSGYGITTFELFTPAAATGTVALQGSQDNTNWVTMNCWQTGTTTAATGAAVSGSALGVFVSCNTDGIPAVRALLSPWTAGNFTVNVGVSAMPRAK